MYLKTRIQKVFQTFFVRTKFCFKTIYVCYVLSVAKCIQIIYNSGKQKKSVSVIKTSSPTT